ncbi:MAG TPA: TonB-dependent receptor [Ferruginibacter sp.]|nr:TonB-dependent receptor [Ferruginibacter sp.]
MKWLLVAAFLFPFTLLAQKGKIDGKITDSKTGNPIAGVSVVIKETGKGISTGTDGRFVLSVEPGKKYTLVISSASYQGKEISEVEAGSDGIAHIDITLDVKATTGEEVVVRSTSAKKETVNALISFQRTTNTVASVISAEAIRRSPDKNTGEVLKRTPGASIQEGKFIVIRGLADRYNQAMINGILLTSTEPDRKTFSFDLIPSSMIDNLIINKAFVPEYPGEWAGGLIQVNTKDIPAKNFFSIQIGSGFNTQTAGHKFYKDAQGGKLDWLGIDDGTRKLPADYTRKAEFDLLSPAEKTAIGKQMRNVWSPSASSDPVNISFQANGGFTTKLFGKNLGGIFGINYSKSNRRLVLLNRSNAIDPSTNAVSIISEYNDTRYQQDIMAGALGSVTLQLNPKNKISAKAIVNVNAHNNTTQRNGDDYSRVEQMRGNEFAFKENTFFTGQLMGEHSISKPLKFKWYGAFNILDGYVPDQRRILYTRTSNTQDPFRLLISNTLSQQSGSRIYQNLSDYIYTAGGDLSYNLRLLGQNQTIKGGYMLQIKDRLYDAQLFANYLPKDNPALRLLPADQVFTAENFGNGTDDKFAFDAIKGNNFRYLANTILNAGFLQFDNQFGNKLRVVWGLRVENYDQLVGSVKKWDPRHSYSSITDFLPGLNATYKLNPKTNLRVSASQTVIRPELRELSSLNLYDFELNASVQGNPLLKRTKVTNLDFRYEIYPRAGEVINAGIFYKHFNNPIEQLFNGLGGGASTLNYANAKKANSFGVEVETRKKLDFIPGMKNFTFQANAAYIHSRVKDEQLDVNRSLQGQSPYILNLGILYDLEKYGLNVTLLFNQIGQRIYLVGDIVGGAPDIYEAPRPVLDLQLAKKVLKKKGEFRLNISDIINKKQYFYQNTNDKLSFQKNTDAFRFTRTYGTTFSITFNYSL